MDVSPVAAQVQLQVQRLVLEQMKALGTSGTQQLVAAATPPPSLDPDLGQFLDVTA